MTDNRTTRYGDMPIEELIDEYAMLAKDPLVSAYIKASDELMTRRYRDYGDNPETEFYKAACGYEYTIELPYDELFIAKDNAWLKHHSYSFAYKEPDGKKWNVCLSLCGYSREEITKMIDARIERLERLESEDSDD